MAAKRKTSKSSKSKTDVYQLVTDAMIQALEADVVPWRKPWRAGQMPRNAQTGRTYSGMNVWLLLATAQMEGYDDPRWLTFNQAKALGGMVRKGEKSTPIVFWKMLQREDADGNDEVFPVLKYWRVFNVGQIDGLDLPAIAAADEREHNPQAAADAIVAGYPADVLPAPAIRHGGARAAYSPRADTVYMPKPGAFETDAAYYHTLFHELVHSTGHPERQKREGIVRSYEASGKFGDHAYSREELIAEMGASYLAALAGIDVDIPQSAAYCRSWINVLRGDAKLIVRAAGAAQRAASYICPDEEAKGELADAA